MGIVLLYIHTENIQKKTSECGREYRKGKQEYNVTPGNRIREIGMH